ncbi:NusG domain II-containing protein [Clostridium sp.]|uniref:NusG domain II-containing protein n=1 Tax=Clostridium sp. TaxID=1506 RepID=UPI003F39A1FD
MFKKWDIIIIVVLMIISFLPEVILVMILGKGYDNTYAEVTIAGELYKNIPLSEHKGEEIIEVKSKTGVNIIKVSDDKISIVEADCPDKVCMKPGFIHKPGESLVCLPNRLMIQIKGNTEEDIIISH